VSDEVLFELSGGVATITLNRPDAMNALSVGMKEQLIDAIGRSRDDGEVRALVLTGAGRGFCAGQDLREHADTLRDGGGSTLDTVRAHYNPIILGLTAMPKPVVAAVNGMAAGAGAALALACDFRIAAETAGFLMAFAKVGLGGDSGATWTLPRLVGRAAATELLMLAEPVGAARALELGLVNEIVPRAALAERSHLLASLLAAGPTVAYGAIKDALAFAADHSLAESLEREADLQAMCGMTEDHRASTLAFLEKTPVTFVGR